MKTIFATLLLLATLTLPVLAEEAINTELIFSSYIGGDKVEWVADLVFDENGDILVVGLTRSRIFFDVEPDSCPGSICYALFLAKINGQSFALEYVHKFGGTGSDLSARITLDDSGFIYIAGTTASSDFPVLNGSQMDYGGGEYDGFVMKLAADGATIIWASYIGGAGYERLLGLAVDPSNGTVYVCGTTNSPDFPLANEVQSSLGGMFDSFITAFSPDGSTLEFSSYYGGIGDDSARSISYSFNGTIVVAGVTTSPDLLTTFTYGPTDNSSADCFAVLFDGASYSQLNSARIGGLKYDAFFSCAVDNQGRLGFGGMSMSDNMPTVNAFQSFHKGKGDMYISLLSADLTEIIYAGYFGGSKLEVARDISFDSVGYVYLTGEEISPDIPLLFPYQDHRIGSIDAVAIKLNLFAPTLSYSTYCGGWWSQGSGAGQLRGDELYCIGGITKSTDYPQINSFQEVHQGEVYDGFVSCFTAPTLGDEVCCRTPGDADHNGLVSIGDVTFVIAYVFSTGDAPTCLDEADANGSGAITIADVTYLITRIFSSGAEPVCGANGY